MASKGGNKGLSTVSEVEDGLLGPWRSSTNEKASVHVDQTFSKVIYNSHCSTLL